VRALVFLLCVAACGGGAQYASGTRQTGGEIDRGEVNGRLFDFVSNKPEGDDWQIRIRGSSMWASYGNEEQTDDLGSVNLTTKETDKVWELIDAVDIPGRKKGKKDVDEGYVELRLGEPGEDNKKEYKTVYISRASEDEELTDLAEYLRGLVVKYKKEKPNF
jgi:hypothetical protein